MVEGNGVYKGLTNFTFSWEPDGSMFLEKKEDSNAKSMPKIKKVIFHNQIATEVIWMDGSITKVVTGKGDTFSPEYGLSMCIAKKYCGSYENFSKSLKKAKHR